MHQPVIIIGGGGHSRVVIGMLKRLRIEIRGIATRDARLFGSDIFGVPVLGQEDEVLAGAQGIGLVNGVGNIASLHGSGLDIRAGIFERYTARGFHFPPILGNDAVIQPNVIIGDGAQVMPGAVIQPGAMIGVNAIINTRASIDHDVQIAPHVHVAPGAVICGGVVIGAQTHIGAGAVVIQGIRIGSGAVIGAGTVVTRDVTDGGVIRPPRCE